MASVSQPRCPQIGVSGLNDVKDSFRAAYYRVGGYISSYPFFMAKGYDKVPTLEELVESPEVTGQSPKPQYQYDLFTGEAVIFSNMKRRPWAKKDFLQPSCTVPGQSMTVEEMLERHKRGLPVQQNSSEPFFDDPDAPSSGINPRTLDYAELQSMQIRNAQHVEELKARLAAERRQAKTQKEKEEVTKKRKLLAELTAEFQTVASKRSTEEGDPVH